MTFYGNSRTEEGDKNEAASAASPPDQHRVALDARLAALAVPADAPEDWIAVNTRSLSPPGWPEQLRTPARLPVIVVHSKDSTLRARRITTQLIAIVTQVGWRFSPKVADPPEPSYYRRRDETAEAAEQRAAHFIVEDERLFISIRERQMRSERPLTPQEQSERRRNPNAFYFRDRYAFHPSGELTLYVSTSTGIGGFSSFRDTKRSPLEARISDIARCLLQGALDIKRRRKEAMDEAERERREEARRERIRRTREAHARLTSRLEAEAGAWDRAQRLRRYIRAARRTLAPGERIEASLEGEAVDLLALGEAFANQLDPLHPTLRSIPFFDGSDPYAAGFAYESEETKLGRFVARVLGGDWRHAPKHQAPDSTSPE